MENDTESPREGTSSFIFVFLTLDDSAVYNMDSKQVATIIKVYGGILAMTCPYCNNEME